MKSPWLEEEQKYQKKYDSSPRISRSRRPVLLAVSAIVLICLWHYGAPTDIHHDLTPNFGRAFDRRSQKSSNIGSGEQGSPGGISVEDTPAIFLPGEHYLAKDATIGAGGVVSPPDEEHNIQNIQLEHQHILEHQQNDDKTVVAHENYEHDEQLPKQNMVDEEDVTRGKVVVVVVEEEEHNPDNNSNPPTQEALQEQKTKTLIREQGAGKEGVIASPDADSKLDARPVENESEDHLSLEEKGEALPEILHIPFEDVVADMKLAGWEDEWVAHASFDVKTWGFLEEPQIDFVYLWVNGSEEAFQDTKRPFEQNSILNDPEGLWLNSHGTNRYRDWDELKYSLRSLETHASGFRNKIQILVNSVEDTKDKKQIPTWLNDKSVTTKVVEVLAQEEFFDPEKHVCLPTFNSLTIENQIFNTPSDVDNIYALSDDMLLGRPHAASDICSPLFGPTMGFKTNAYNTVNPPTAADAARFGEKPFLIYTSWLLNRRFGNRKRAGQGHFGHSLSRSVTQEAIGSFPGPELQSACKRFRGEPGFQLYSWYATFHYLIERHREALLWSYIILRADTDANGNLNWAERQTIIAELSAGMKNEGRSTFRKRNFYHVSQLLERAGLQAPKVNTDIQWTSLDGPAAIRGIDCTEFDVNECLAPGFNSPISDAKTTNPIFSSTVVFDRLARQQPKCGDCLLKLLLNQRARGLEPLLPPKSKPALRELVVKAVMRYRYTIIQPDALFVMVTDAEQVDSVLVNRYVRQGKVLPGQLCLNDDVSTEDEGELRDVMSAMTELYQGLFPEKSPFEK